MAGGKSPGTKAVKMEALRSGTRRMNHAWKCNGGKHMEGSTIKRRMEEPNPDSNNLDVPKRKENLKARLTPSTAYPNWARVGHYLLLMLLVMRHMGAPLTVEVEHGKNLTEGELDTLRYRGPEAMVEAAEPQLKENMHRKRLTGGELDTLLSRGVGTLQSEPLRGRPGNNPLSRSPDTLWHLQMGRTVRKLMNQAYQSITSTSGRFKCAEFWDKGFSSGGTNLGTRCCWEKDKNMQVGDVILRTDEPTGVAEYQVTAARGARANKDKLGRGMTMDDKKVNRSPNPSGGPAQRREQAGRTTPERSQAEEKAREPSSWGLGQGDLSNSVRVKLAKKEMAKLNKPEVQDFQTDESVQAQHRDQDEYEGETTNKGVRWKDSGGLWVQASNPVNREGEAGSLEEPEPTLQGPAGMEVAHGQGWELATLMEPTRVSNFTGGRRKNCKCARRRAHSA